MTDSAVTEFHRLDIPFQPELRLVRRQLRFSGGNARRDAVLAELVAAARAVARPRGIYLTSSVRPLDRDAVTIGGVRFESRVLARCLAGHEEVYPFLVTVGGELDELKTPPGELFRQFCLDAIKTAVLIAAVEYLTERVKEVYALAGTAHINPGELADWPITQQRPLFRLFGAAAGQIGVKLTPGGAMRPLKSRSGIIFADTSGFVSCRLCTQADCPGRRAAYDPALVREYTA